MWSARFPLSIVLSSLAMLFIADGEARSQTFDYVFCNKTNVKVFVAIAAQMSPKDHRFLVQGWWSIPADQCGNIGAFPRGWVYYYAEQEDPGTAYWGADDDRSAWRIRDRSSEFSRPITAAAPTRQSRDSRQSSSSPIPAR